MSTPLLAAIRPSTSRPSSTCTSPMMTDCSTLLRSLWTDLSSDVCAVSSSITSWISSWTGSMSSTCSGLSCGMCHISRPHRLSIDDYFHWLRHHRTTWLHTISRPQHQRRRGTYLLLQDESDDERDGDDTVQDEREETLVMSYQHYARQMEQQRQSYVPQTCLCQRINCQHNTTCRNTTLMVAACAGLYERASLRHAEFVAPRHLGVATDDVVVPPITSLPSSTTSSCDSSSDMLSVPSSPHLSSSSWSDDDTSSDVDMSRSSSPMPSPLTLRMDSDDSMDMMDSESDMESEHDGGQVMMDGDMMDPYMIPSSKKSSLRRRSSTHAWLPGMSRSRSLQQLTQDTVSPSTTTPLTSCGLKTRRLASSSSSSTPSTPKDVMDQLWSIQDTTQLQAMKQSFREMHIASNVCAV